eukprot:10444922-Lingulodinium_polyedra.AAC.1
MQSGEAFSNTLRIAVVMRWAPLGVRSALRAASHSIGGDYDRLRQTLKEVLIAGRSYDGHG